MLGGAGELSLRARLRSARRSTSSWWASCTLDQSYTGYSAGRISGLFKMCGKWKISYLELTKEELNTSINVREMWIFMKMKHVSIFLQFNFLNFLNRKIHIFIENPVSGLSASRAALPSCRGRGAGRTSWPWSPAGFQHPAGPQRSHPLP